MFDKEFILEILNTIKKNKLRSSLTGFAAAWGIFMLIVLLGSGKGLENGIKANFAGEAKNTMRFFGGITSKPYKGQVDDRQIIFNNFDKQIIKQNIPQIDILACRYDLETDIPVEYKNEYASLSISGIDAAIKLIEKNEIVCGRYINVWDIKNKAKIAVIGKDVKEMLFKKISPINKTILINKVPFKIVGVFTDDYSQENKKIYIPLTTAQQLFLGGNSISGIMMTLNNVSQIESKSIEKKVKSLLAKRHNFDTQDESAIFILNSIEEFARARKLFNAVKIFLWLIGIGTIVAGIVGISNIMLIVVKERTKEIGIRKAIGATPSSIVKLILFEAMVITIFAGSLGVIAGTSTLEISNKIIESKNKVQNSDGSDDELTIFKDPGVDIIIIFNAFIVLMSSGLIAGYIPAKKAAEIKPITALREG